MNKALALLEGNEKLKQQIKGKFLLIKTYKE
jgi:hypothetical protein